MRFEILCHKGASSIAEWVTIDAWNFDDAVRRLHEEDYTPSFPISSRQYQIVNV